MYNIVGIITKMVFLIFFFTIVLYGGYRITKSIVRDFKQRNVKKAFFKTIAVLVIIFGGMALIYNSQIRNLPVRVYEGAEKYVMNINEVKKSESGTKVRVNYVLLDLNSISFNLGVKGKDKLVAVQIKKDRDSPESVKDINGLWTGKRFFYESMAFSATYSSDSFMAPVYLVCHLSDGGELSFKIEDEKNVKEKVKIIKLDKVFDDDGMKIGFDEFVKGVNYSSFKLVSDINLFKLETSIIADGKEYKNLGGSSAGGLLFYGGPPVGNGEVIVKIKDKDNGNEYKLRVQ